jgi:hypothetical protein
VPVSDGLIVVRGKSAVIKRDVAHGAGTAVVQVRVFDDGVVHLVRDRRVEERSRDVFGYKCLLTEAVELVLFDASIHIHTTYE